MFSYFLESILKMFHDILKISSNVFKKVMTSKLSRVALLLVAVSFVKLVVNPHIVGISWHTVPFFILLELTTSILWIMWALAILRHIVDPKSDRIVEKK